MSRSLWLCILFCGVLTSCTGESVFKSRGPDKILVGVLPDESLENLELRHRPLVRHLRKSLDREVELVIHESYEELVDDFCDGGVQLALFGGVTYLKAKEKSGAVPIAMRRVDLEFTSVFLVPGSSTATSIDEFEGKRFRFAAELSTSGHLMPRYFLESRGIHPESFFSEVEYSREHEAAARAVREGRADIAVASAQTVKKMYRKGSLREKDVRVLSSTPKFNNYVWAACPKLGAGLCRQMLDAFLELDLTNEEHQSILERQGAVGYVPAFAEDFEALESIARSQGVLDPETKT